MKEVVVHGTKIRLDPTKSIGVGGEAYVYDIGRGTALKVYKQPNDPDYKGMPAEQAGARDRLKLHQKKLPDFPRNLPRGVVAPRELAHDKPGGQIVGYTMDLIGGTEVLLRYSDKSYRAAGVDPNLVVPVFSGLHETVRGIHSAHAVIGDFNDLNILVQPNGASHIVDADSFQFGPYPCRMFTARFVDPTLCNPRAKSLMLQKAHNENSDWYAYAVMLMQFLLYVDPYGGVFRPKNTADRMTHGERPLYRVTVFNNEVKYPKPAIPYAYLPDDLLDRFHRIFEKDERGEFPLALVSSLRWTSCKSCGLEHARSICPQCSVGAATPVKEVTTVRGKVTATRIFRTAGVILYAAVQNGNLSWVYHENDKFKRENDEIVINGALDPAMRFRISGKSTLLAKDQTLVKFSPAEGPVQISLDTYGSLPMMDANGSHYYWINSGQLYRDGFPGDFYIGDVLRQQTLFWVGPTFGFGFYRAGALTTAFVFDSETRGLNDRVQLPDIRGRVVDATCVFGKDLAWFLLSTQERGKTINRCTVVGRDGGVLATAEADEHDGSWLGSLRGKTAAAGFLLAPTDEGVVRVEPDNGMITVTRKFPDTDHFVDSASHLHADASGLIVVGSKEITRLKIA